MKNDIMYKATIPILIHFLSVLSGIIDKGNRYATRGKKVVTTAKLLEGRLAPDMFNFIQQVGYAYFMALEMSTNLTGKEIPKFTYDEKSGEELKASLTRVIQFLKSIKPKDVAYSEKKRMKTFLDPEVKVSRDTYIHMMALPNFFFHVTTAYDIYRHLGVSLKKDDYLGL